MSISHEDMMDVELSSLSEGERNSAAGISMWSMFFLATPVQILVGGKFTQKAWDSARNGVLGMDALVTMGTTAAYGYSVIMYVVEQKKNKKTKKKTRSLATTNVSERVFLHRFIITNKIT